MQIDLRGLGAGLTAFGKGSSDQPGQQTATSCPAGTLIYMAGRNAACPHGYVFVRNTGGAIGVPWKTECQCIGVAPAQQSAPPPAPVYQPPIVTVSPAIQVSPQISPIFQQQFQPTNSPATAGTTQNIPTTQSGGSSNPEPSPPPVQLPPQVPVYIPASAPAPEPSAAPIYGGGGGSYVEPVYSAPAPVAEKNLPDWLPYAIGLGIAGLLGVMIMNGKDNRNAIKRRVTRY